MPCHYSHFRPFVLVLLITFFTGCSTTKYVTVPEVRSDTVRITQHERDSIYLHDSIYVNQYSRGDTVYFEVQKWHIQYRDRWNTDTAYISRRDSVPVPYPVEKQVPAQLSWWQQARLWLANVILVVLAVLAAVWILKKRAWWLSIIRKFF